MSAQKKTRIVFGSNVLLGMGNGIFAPYVPLQISTWEERAREKTGKRMSDWIASMLGTWPKDINPRMYQQLYEAVPTPKVHMTINKNRHPVNAQSRKLKATWSVDSSNDLMLWFGVNREPDLYSRMFAWFNQGTKTMAFKPTDLDLLPQHTHSTWKDPDPEQVLARWKALLKTANPRSVSKIEERLAFWRPGAKLTWAQQEAEVKRAAEEAKREAQEAHDRYMQQRFPPTPKANKALNQGPFAKYVFPVIRQVFAQPISHSLVSVQPMSSPHASIFLLNTLFGPEEALGTRIEAWMAARFNYKLPIIEGEMAQSYYDQLTTARFQVQLAAALGMPLQFMGIDMDSAVQSRVASWLSIEEPEVTAEPSIVLAGRDLSHTSSPLYTKIVEPLLGRIVRWWEQEAKSVWTTVQYLSQPDLPDTDVVVVEATSGEAKMEKLEIDLSEFKPKQGFRTHYAKKLVRQDLYGTITISGMNEHAVLGQRVAEWLVAELRGLLDDMAGFRKFIAPSLRNKFPNLIGIDAIPDEELIARICDFFHAQPAELNKLVLALLANNPETPPDQLKVCVTGGTWESASLALANPNVPFEVWSQYAFIDPTSALGNPSLALWLLEDSSFLTKLEFGIVRALATSYLLRGEMLDILILAPKHHAASTLEEYLGVLAEAPSISEAQQLMIHKRIHSGAGPALNEPEF